MRVIVRQVMHTIAERQSIVVKATLTTNFLVLSADEDPFKAQPLNRGT